MCPITKASTSPAELAIRSSPSLMAPSIADGLYAGDPQRCGLGVMIRHWDSGRRIRFCHLSAVTVKAGDPVKRGDVIGLMGATGNAGPTPHIHWEIRRRDNSTEDPLAVTDGCFTPSKVYPDDQFILTLPVKCGAAR